MVRVSANGLVVLDPGEQGFSWGDKVSAQLIALVQVYTRRKMAWPAPAWETASA